MKKVLTALILFSVCSLPMQPATSKPYSSNKQAKEYEQPSPKPSVKLVKRGSKTFVVGKVKIGAPRERIWDVLVDYDRAPEIFNNLSLCTVVGSKGEAKLVRQLVKPGGPIKFDYVVNLREHKPRLIEWNRESGSFKEVAGSWLLEESEDRAHTVVTYSIHLDGGLLLPNWLLSSQVKGYLPTVLNSLKNKAEAVNRKDDAIRGNTKS